MVVTLKQYEINGGAGREILDKFYSQDESKSILKGTLNPIKVFNGVIILENEILIYTNMLPKICISGEEDKVNLVKNRLEQELGRRLL